MNSFWIGFCEQLRRRGAWVFAITLLLFMGVVLVATIVCKAISDSWTGASWSQLEPYAGSIGVGLAILFAAIAIRQARKPRRAESKRPRLSRDELNKARSKLTDKRNLKSS
jgi:hypothetical protein